MQMCTNYSELVGAVLKTYEERRRLGESQKRKEPTNANVTQTIDSSNSRPQVLPLHRGRIERKSPMDEDTAAAATALISLPNSNDKIGDKERQSPNQKIVTCSMIQSPSEERIKESKLESFYVSPSLSTVSTGWKQLRTSDSSPKGLYSSSQPGKRIDSLKCTLASACDSKFLLADENLRKPKFFTGSTSLAMPDDEDSLSPLHCFLRKYCVEAFSATEEDVALPRFGRVLGGNISVGQVGIRCVHCKDKPLPERAERAVCYPSSIGTIYHAIDTWQRRHSIVCRDIPPWVKQEMAKLMKNSRSNAGGRRQYWTDAAAKLGMYDTPNGVRFGKDPNIDLDFSSDSDEEDEASLAANETVQRLTFPEDKELVSNYLFLLMDQMKPCQFSEEDRTGGRSKVKQHPIGYPGLQCRHCSGKAGLGRYFPSSFENLISNSDRNIFNHMLKCRRCPEDTKAALRAFHKCHIVEGSKNKRGSRKVFFSRIWYRMHHCEQAK